LVGDSFRNPREDFSVASPQPRESLGSKARFNRAKRITGLRPRRRRLDPRFYEELFDNGKVGRFDRLDAFLRLWH
jgi:hypothetical protein